MRHADPPDLGKRRYRVVERAGGEAGEDVVRGCVLGGCQYVTVGACRMSRPAAVADHQLIERDHESATPGKMFGHAVVRAARDPHVEIALVLSSAMAPHQPRA